MALLLAAKWRREANKKQIKVTKPRCSYRQFNILDSHRLCKRAVCNTGSLAIESVWSVRWTATWAGVFRQALSGHRRVYQPVGHQLQWLGRLQWLIFIYIFILQVISNRGKHRLAGDAADMRQEGQSLGEQLPERSPAESALIKRQFMRHQKCTFSLSLPNLGLTHSPNSSLFDNLSINLVINTKSKKEITSQSKHYEPGQARTPYV